MQNIKLPYIPEDTEKEMDKLLLNQQHQKLCESLIKEIQMHPDHKKGTKRSEQELSIGADLGVKLAHRMITTYQEDNRKLMNKYQTLILAFMKNGDITQMLLDG